MVCNVGKIDRALRAIVGVGALAYGINSQNIIFDAIGGVMLFTAALGWCPPYSLFGINTGCKQEPKNQ